MIFTSSSALRGLLQPAPLLGSVPGTSRGTHCPWARGGKRNLWNCIWEHPKSSHRSDPAQFLFPSQGKCCCFSRNVPVPQTTLSQFPGNLGILQGNGIFWPWPHTQQERPFQFEPNNFRNHVQLLKYKLRSCRFLLKSIQECSSFM